MGWIVRVSVYNDSDRGRGKYVMMIVELSKRRVLLFYEDGSTEEDYTEKSDFEETKGWETFTS